VKSNIFYECKKCGTKGILVENVKTFNFNKIEKLSCVLGLAISFNPNTIKNLKQKYS